MNHRYYYLGRCMFLQHVHVFVHVASFVKTVLFASSASPSGT
jgi:hypothetical protein